MPPIHFRSAAMRSSGGESKLYLPSKPMISAAATSSRSCFGGEVVRDRFVFRVELADEEVDDRRAVLLEDGCELRVAVIRKVTAGLIHFDAADVRGVDRLIAALHKLAADEPFQFAANDRPFGHPQNQARADERADGEQVELFAQQAMVSFLRLFDLGEVGFEVFLVEERGGIEPLQLLAGGESPFQ